MIYRVEDLKFGYDSNKTVLNNVNICLKEGELLTVLGRNGAGKSTFFGCLLGLNKPSEGKIFLCDRELSGMKEREIASIVGFVPQNHSAVFGYTVFDFVLMGCASGVGLFSKPGKKEEDAVWEALETMGLTDFAERPYGELSGGERQQVTIARAIAQKPKAIIFDEPTAHLDFSNQMKVLRVIKELSEKGFAVAVSTHDPNHALLLGGSAALFDGSGNVEYGSVKELVSEEKLKRVYGSDLKVRYLDEFEREVCIYPAL